jgi:hypothetical protein
MLRGLCAVGYGRGPGLLFIGWGGEVRGRWRCPAGGRVHFEDVDRY